MTIETVDITTRDGVADAYLARPDQDQHPGVLLLMDAVGLRPQIERMAERIAGLGYVVLAPNLYYRAGRSPLFDAAALMAEGGRAKLWESAGPLMAALEPAAYVRDAGAYLDALGRHAPGKAGLTGYCMGVALAVRTAAAYPDRVAAAAGFHGGMLVNDRPDSPHRNVDGITAELFLAHAHEDAANPPESIAALDTALDAARVRHETEVWPVSHGYTMADLPAYDEAAAERHYAALDALFGRALG